LFLSPTRLCHRYFNECLKIRFFTGTKRQFVPSAYKFLLNLIEVALGRGVGEKRSPEGGLKGRKEDGLGSLWRPKAAVVFMQSQPFPCPPHFVFPWLQQLIT
jgi:hypothetical protein